ncbi:MAG: tyrosine--tRNA ligase, partial [Gemmatimonadetes bacterium]|nr:tyrosine--tRNA ligase [Gemmatimonadota bacterium]
QMGGSDQWGNITAGTDLIRRVKGARAWGVVWPLMTTASGVKFGKTEAGTVWLDPERTSPFRFYQFWLNTDDADAVRWLKAFTLFDRSRVEELETALATEPAGRAAQRALAEDVTRRVHGEDGLARARKATDVLFGGTLEGLGAAEIADIFADVPAADVPRTHLSGEGRPILDLLAETGVTPSKGEARRAVEGGGIYVNGVRVDGIERSVTLDDTIEGRFLVLRRGKKNHHLVRVVG